MKIQQTNLNKYYLNNNYKTTINSGMYSPIKNNTNDVFESKNKPSFKGYKVDKKKFNILNQPDSSIKGLAEIFAKESDSNIKDACKTRYGNIVIDFLTESGKEKYMLAYDKFMPFVEQAREHAQDVENRITTLSELAAKGDSNMVKKQQELSKLFFELLKIEQSGREIPKQNGIMVYGSAPNADKEEFVEWFKTNVPAQVKEFTFDLDKPFESIKQMVSIAEDAEKLYQITGKRTILHLKDIDFLLTSDYCLENIKMIARFKQFVEHCSEMYHTTLLMNTTFKLEDFETASIASHRFETKINLKEGIKPKQKEELKKLQEEKDRLDKAVSGVNKYFWYEDDSYDNSSNSSDDDVIGGTWGDYCDYLKYS